MEIKEFFPEIEKQEPPPKIRKVRRKSSRYNTSENNRRYKLHRKLKDLNLENVTLFVRQKIIETPVMFDIDLYPVISELVSKFKYEIPTRLIDK